MNIALIAHDKKKELMVQFCIAYSGILSKHNLCSTGTTGKIVSEATGLKIQKFLGGPEDNILEQLTNIVMKRYGFSNKEVTMNNIKHGTLFFIKGRKMKYMWMVDEAMKTLLSIPDYPNIALFKSIFDELWNGYSNHLNDTHPGVDLIRFIINLRDDMKNIIAYVFIVLVYIGNIDNQLIEFLYRYQVKKRQY